MSDFDKGPIRQEVSPQEKLVVLSQVLPVMADYEQVVVSGSLSQLLSEKSVEGRVNTDDIDLSHIHDIDLAFCGGDFRENRQVTEKFSSLSNDGFPVNSENLVDALAYNQDLQHLGIRTIVVVDKGGEYQIRVMTPAYLLVTLVDQDVSEKTPSEKYVRKILEIQAMSTFRRSDFLTIAHLDIRQRYLMNKDTFNRWVRMATTETDDAKADMLASYNQYSSIVDEAMFKNELRVAGTVRELDYDQVRKQTNLEKFVREMENGEEK